MFWEHRKTYRNHWAQISIQKIPVIRNSITKCIWTKRFILSVLYNDKLHFFWRGLAGLKHIGEAVVFERLNYRCWVTRIIKHFCTLTSSCIQIKWRQLRIFTDKQLQLRTENCFVFTPFSSGFISDSEGKWIKQGWKVADSWRRIFNRNRKRGRAKNLLN